MDIKWCSDKEYLNQMVRFQVEMAWETEKFELSESTVRKGILTQINSPSTGRYLLALKDSELVGMLLTINEWSDWRCKNVLWIHSVYVRPEYRGQKVYRSLYEFIQGEVKGDDSIAGIRLYVDKTNIKAQEVYKKLGMNNEHYSLFEWMK